MSSHNQWLRPFGSSQLIESMVMVIPTVLLSLCFPPNLPVFVLSSSEVHELGS